MAVVKAEEFHEEEDRYDGPRIQRIVDRENNQTALLVPEELWARLMGEMDELEHKLAALEEQLAPGEKTKAQVKAELQAKREALASVPTILRVTDSANALKAIVIPPDDWERLLEQLDDLEDYTALAEEDLNPSEGIPWEQAVREMEAAWAAREVSDNH